jgi:hypothetical protein
LPCEPPSLLACVLGTLAKLAQHGTEHPAQPAAGTACCLASILRTLCHLSERGTEKATKAATGCAALLPGLRSGLRASTDQSIEKLLCVKHHDLPVVPSLAPCRIM